MYFLDNLIYSINNFFSCDRALTKNLAKGQYEELLKESRKLEIDLPQIQQLKQVMLE